MRRKRLQHVANNLCQMFCGWQLLHCKPILVALGSGHLEIDALCGECSFAGRAIDTLSIARALQDQVERELASNGIPRDGLLSARLGVELTFSIVPWHTSSEEFFANGERLETAEMHRCEFACRSEVRTDEVTYVGELVETQAWPVGWPSD